MGFWFVDCNGIDHIMVGTDYPYISAIGMRRKKSSSSIFPKPIKSCCWRATPKSFCELSSDNSYFENTGQAWRTRLPCFVSPYNTRTHCHREDTKSTTFGTLFHSKPSCLILRNTALGGLTALTLPSPANRARLNKQTKMQCSAAKNPLAHSDGRGSG